MDTASVLGSVLGVFVAWLLGVVLSLWVFYLIIRRAVRSGVRWAIKDSVADPALRLAVIDIAGVGHRGAASQLTAVQRAGGCEHLFRQPSASPRLKPCGSGLAQYVLGQHPGEAVAARAIGGPSGTAEISPVDARPPQIVARTNHRRHAVVGDREAMPVPGDRS